MDTALPDSKGSGLSNIPHCSRKYSVILDYFTFSSLEVERINEFEERSENEIQHRSVWSDIKEDLTVTQ